MINFGIIGAGNIAARFVNASTLVDDAKVVAVSSKSFEKAKEFAKKNDVAEAYGDYSEMLEKADIDAVYVATTHNYHFENVMLALKAGKHVICEKPFVLTSAEAREAFSFAKKHGLFVMEAMWSRFLPHIQKAKEWIDGGEIGTVEYASSHIGWRATFDPKSRIFAPELAGGALYDIGVYPLEILTYLIPEKLCCVDSAVTLAETGVDKVSQITMKFENCIASVIASISAFTPEETVICGTKGYIKMRCANVSDEATLVCPGKPDVHFKQPYKNGFTFELEEACRKIIAGETESDVMPHSATIETAEIFEKVLRK